MGNELTAWLNNDANLPTLDAKELGAALTDAGRDNSNGGGIPFLSFNGKFGRWTTGKNKDAVDPEDLFIVEPSTFTEGWTFWMGNTVPQGGNVEWPVLQRRQKSVREDELDDPSNGGRLADGDGWKATAGFMCMTSNGVAYKFNNNSKSGVGAIADLMNECGQRSMAEEPNIPVMTLSEETFMAQQKQNFKPVFVVEAWVDRDVMMAYAKGEIKLPALLKNELKVAKMRGRKKPAKK